MKSGTTMGDTANAKLFLKQLNISETDLPIVKFWTGACKA